MSRFNTMGFHNVADGTMRGRLTEAMNIFTSALGADTGRAGTLYRESTAGRLRVRFGTFNDARSRVAGNTSVVFAGTNESFYGAAVGHGADAARAAIERARDDGLEVRINVNTAHMRSIGRALGTLTHEFGAHAHRQLEILSAVQSGRSVHHIAGLIDEGITSGSLTSETHHREFSRGQDRSYTSLRDNVRNQLNTLWHRRVTSHYSDFVKDVARDEQTHRERTALSAIMESSAKFRSATRRPRAPSDDEKATPHASSSRARLEAFYGPLSSGSRGRSASMDTPPTPSPPMSPSGTDARARLRAYYGLDNSGSTSGSRSRSASESSADGTIGSGTLHIPPRVRLQELAAATSTPVAPRTRRTRSASFTRESTSGDATVAPRRRRTRSLSNGTQTP